MLKDVIFMEQNNESTLATPWLERRKSTDTSTINDIDFWTMLEELSRGQQQ